ncbi:hypothetical protein ACI7BZ_11420 [Xanthobacter sp. AM11]
MFMGEPDRDNPFTGLNFEERTKTKLTSAAALGFVRQLQPKQV